MLLLAWAGVGLLHWPAAGGAAQDAKSGDAAATTATAAAPAGQPGEPQKKELQSFFSWFIQACGIIGLGVLLPLSIYFVATVSRLFMEMRPVIAMPPEIIANCEALLEQRDFKSIFGVVKEDNSFFSTALSTGIGELPNGLAEAREAMEKVGESVTAEMDKKISMLAVLGTLGPMIGLLGTLTGMIESFQSIARGGENLNPQEVAGRDFEGAGVDAVGRRALRAGDLFLCLIPQPSLDDLGDNDGSRRPVPPPFRSRSAR